MINEVRQLQRERTGGLAENRADSLLVDPDEVVLEGHFEDVTEPLGVFGTIDELRYAVRFADVEDDSAVIRVDDLVEDANRLGPVGSPLETSGHADDAPVWSLASESWTPSAYADSARSESAISDGLFDSITATLFFWQKARN